MRRLKWILLAFIFLMPLHASAQAEDSESGNAYLVDCRALITLAEGVNLDQVTSFKAGQCMGAVHVLWGFMKGNRAMCFPPNMPLSQLVRVIVKFLEDHPARLNESFVVLASSAMHDVWACAPATRR